MMVDLKVVRDALAAIAKELRADPEYDGTPIPRALQPQFLLGVEEVVRRFGWMTDLGEFDDARPYRALDRAMAFCFKHCQHSRGARPGSAKECAECPLREVTVGDLEARTEEAMGGKDDER